MRVLERVELAKNRIRKILGTRLLANMKQLESKISESGPFNKRCDPHIIHSAVGQLEAEDLLNSIKDPSGAKFFVRDDFDASFDPEHLARQNRIFHLYGTYQKLSKDRTKCGDVLEDVIWDALAKTGKYTPIGSRSHPVKIFGSIVLPGYLDIVATPKEEKNFFILGEAKNRREWIYPSSELLWTFIHKCVVFTDSGHPVAPVFIARRIQFSTRYLFKRIGILGAQTFQQLYSPDTEEDLQDIKHKDGLGFHTTSTNTTTPPWMIKWFDSTVWSHAENSSKKFYDSLPILRKHSENLASGMRGEARKKYWRRVSVELGLSHNYDDSSSS